MINCRLTVACRLPWSSVVLCFVELIWVMHQERESLTLPCHGLTSVVRHVVKPNAMLCNDVWSLENRTFTSCWTAVTAPNASQQYKLSDFVVAYQFSLQIMTGVHVPACRACNAESTQSTALCIAWWFAYWGMAVFNLAKWWVQSDLQAVTVYLTYHAHAWLQTGLFKAFAAGTLWRWVLSGWYGYNCYTGVFSANNRHRMHLKVRLLNQCRSILLCRQGSDMEQLLLQLQEQIQVLQSQVSIGRPLKCLSYLQCCKLIEVIESETNGPPHVALLICTHSRLTFTNTATIV